MLQIDLNFVRILGSLQLFTVFFVASKISALAKIRDVATPNHPLASTWLMCQLKDLAKLLR